MLDLFVRIRNSKKQNNVNYNPVAYNSNYKIPDLPDPFSAQNNNITQRTRRGV